MTPSILGNHSIDQQLVSAASSVTSTASLFMGQNVIGLDMDPHQLTNHGAVVCSGVFPSTFNGNIRLYPNNDYYQYAYLKVTVQYSCYTGFHISGQANNKTKLNVTCGQSGEWSYQPDQIQCEASSCGIPKIENSVHVNYTSITFKSNASVRCSYGFYWSLSKSEDERHGKINCLDNYSWSEGSCIGVTCDSHQVPNATPNITTNVSHPERFPIHCNLGYVFSGIGVAGVSSPTAYGHLSCQANKTWNGECIDYDECLYNNHTCHQHASCSNIIGSFECACNSGFAGDGQTICNTKFSIPSPDTTRAIVIFEKTSSNSPWNATNIYTTIDNNTVINENSEAQPFALVAYPSETSQQNVPGVFFQGFNTSESNWVTNVTNSTFNVVTFKQDGSNLSIHFSKLPWEKEETADGDGIEHRAKYRPFQLNCYIDPHMYTNCSWEESALNANNSFTASLNQGQPYEFQLFRVHRNSTLDILTGPESNSSKGDDEPARQRKKRDNSVMDDVIAADGYTLPVPLVVPLAETQPIVAKKDGAAIWIYVVAVVAALLLFIAILLVLVLVRRHKNTKVYNPQGSQAIVFPRELMR
ncbi:uncharacterized protein LOC135827054 [Sycon ciliatum]|uniref:uncharacterized protein LOC135827054 n=1 Tax=Sycon ciliatum TaxID=27933 RepID=UPI0031F608C2